MFAQRLLRLGAALVLGGIVVCAGCRADEAAVRDAPRGRHLVVLIHGIYGNASHFGQMEAALEMQMNRLVPDYRWEAVSFEYDTFSTTGSVDEFARDLGDFLLRNFGKEPAAGDRLSLVMHSQGGLVGAVWAGRAAAGEASFHPVLLPHLDGFVTLATPWWGAKIATWTRGIEPWRREHAVTDLSPAARQLVDMSLGSDQGARFRRQAVEAAEHGPPTALAAVRPLSLGGYVAWLKPAAALSAGESEYEDDTAVPLPSSRPGFLYGRATSRGYPAGGEETRASAFKEAPLAPWVLVNAIHLSPVVEVPQLSRGIAQVQSACIEDLGCGHPSFEHVVAHLARRPLPSGSDALERMTSFMLEIEVRLEGRPKGEVEAGIEVEVVYDRVQPDGIEVARLLEPLSGGPSPVAGQGAVQRHWSFGVAPKSWDKGAAADRRVRFVVKAPGYKPRRVEAKVRATWSTWVEVLLEPLETQGAPPAKGPVKTPGGTAVTPDPKGEGSS